MKTTSKVLILIMAILVMAAVVFAKTRVTKEEAVAAPKTYSITKFLNPNWEIAMHEVFTHYLQAANTFGQGDYQTTIAFLRCMEFYIKFLPALVPATTAPPDVRPIDKAKYRLQIRELKKNTIRLRMMVERKDYRSATNVAPDMITKLCFDCHKEAKVPPKWKLGGYKVVDE